MPIIYVNEMYLFFTPGFITTDRNENNQKWYSDVIVRINLDQKYVSKNKISSVLFNLREML